MNCVIMDVNCVTMGDELDVSEHNELDDSNELDDNGCKLDHNY